jgi:hypothetical protein
VGGLAGGLAGLVGGNGEDERSRYLRQQAEQFYNQVPGRERYQAGPAAQANVGQFAGQQQTLADMLFALSNGQGPSLASEQLRAGADRAAANQAGMAAGAVGRGVNSGAA